MVYNMSKAYVQIRSHFSVRARRKCINFSQITVATTAVTSKVTYHKVYLGKV